MVKPCGIVNILENGRYESFTLTFMYEEGICFIINSSKQPFHPQGYFVFEEGFLDVEEWLEENKGGKKIGWDQLPEGVKKYVVQYIIDLN